MRKYEVLIFVYLVSVVSSSIANFNGIDVQILYRVPFLNVRWIDVAILIIPLSILFTPTNYRKIKNDSIIFLCLAYLGFETFQLIRTWGVTDSSWQISGFIATLCYIILIDLSILNISQQRIFLFLKYLIFWGTIALIIDNSYLIYSFFTGNVIFTDLAIRVDIDVLGAKETVSTAVLTPLVYAFGLYFIKHENILWKKLIYLAAIFSILITLVLTIKRGELFTLALITIIYIFAFSSNAVQLMSKLFGVVFLVFIFLLLFSNTLQKKDYDPVEKIIQIAEFSVDVDNPDWEKGRSIPIEFAISAWKKNRLIGVGYNDLYNFGLPKGMGAAHNFIVASLFQRGIIGTGIYILILGILFGNSINLWFLLRREKSLQNDMFRILIVVSFFWLVPAMTQDVIWEKYSLSVLFIYLAIIRNIYIQRRELMMNKDTKTGYNNKIIFNYNNLKADLNNLIN